MLGGEGREPASWPRTASPTSSVDTRRAAPAAFVSWGPGTSSVPPSGAHTPTGAETTLEFLFLSKVNRSSKGQQLTFPRDSLRSPATNLRAVPGGGDGDVPARRGFPTPLSRHFRVPAAALRAPAGTALLPRERQPRALTFPEHAPAAVPARPWPLAAGPGNRSSACARASGPNRRSLRPLQPAETLDPGQQPLAPGTCKRTDLKPYPTPASGA